MTATKPSENELTKSHGVRKIEPTATKGCRRPRILSLLLRMGTIAPSANRVQKRGRYIAEDLLEDLAHAVKKRPIRSVAFGATVAFGAGTLVGWLCSRPRASTPAEIVH